VNDPLIARFADACGASGPLDLRVDLVGGGVLAEGVVDQPFTLVGRDDACDVTLSDPEVNMRHAWLQVVGGRVFAVDLGSRTGLVWPSGTRGSSWLDVGSPVRIGPFHLHLRSSASENPSSFPTGYNPMAADTAAKSRPTVALEFRNGRRAKDRWNVNRLLTLIGRAADCKIHLNADDISPYHCGIVSTRTGLWVVDLSGRGVVVNGERMRVAPLGQGAELWIGRFLIACQYQVPPQPPTASGSRPSPLPAPTGKSGRLATTATGRLDPGAPTSTGDSQATPVPVAHGPLPSDDEIELNATDEEDLSASHILGDAFKPPQPHASEGMSNPILVSGSGPKPVPGPRALADTAGESPTAPADDWAMVPLLRQMADMHGRTAAEFQQTLALLTQLFRRVKREHLVVLQHELNRIQEITAQIAELQAEVARQTVEFASAERARQTAPEATSAGASWVPPSSQTPPPEPPPVTPPAARATERLAALQQERATRWQSLIALFAGM
jgi:pSer/pThr/pTyr-binding forkhead associated (FHA) protein